MSGGQKKRLRTIQKTRLGGVKKTCGQKKGAGQINKVAGQKNKAVGQKNKVTGSKKS
jgi:hypothetical protein